MELDLEHPPALYYTCEDSMFDNTCYIFDIESQHMPSNTNDIDPAFRQQAMSLILNLSSHKDLDPSVSYLAINYLDRFLSTRAIQNGKPWILKLVVVSCVSLALKITKTEVQDPPLRQALTARATEIIFKSQCEFKILEFRPSVAAASAVLSAAHELFPLQFISLEQAILTCSYVDKMNLEKCNTLMQDIATNEYESVFGIVSDTPVDVLDQRQWSSCSGSTGTGSVEMRDCKRRRVGSHGSD